MRTGEPQQGRSSPGAAEPGHVLAHVAGPPWWAYCGHDDRRAQALFQGGNAGVGCSISTLPNHYRTGLNQSRVRRSAYPFDHEPAHPFSPRGNRDARHHQPEPAAPHGPLDRGRARRRAAPRRRPGGGRPRLWRGALDRGGTADPAARGGAARARGGHRDRTGPGRRREAVRARRAHLPARRLRGPARRSPAPDPRRERAASVRRGAGRRGVGAAVRAARAGRPPRGGHLRRDRAPATFGWRSAPKARAP